MKSHPILFSAEMIQAILAGEKSQTRRIVTKHRSGPCDTAHKTWLDWDTIYPNNPFGIKVPSKLEDTVHRVYPPYEVGDQLWVRETFRPVTKDIRDPNTYQRIDTVVDYYEYKADKQPHIQELIKWRPSIFMPREASRITLEVTDIRVERLHDITEKDAMAEGVEMDVWNMSLVGRNYMLKDEWFQDWTEEVESYVQTDQISRASFKSLWEKINGKGSWEKNPWVWVVTFKRIEALSEFTTVNQKKNLKRLLNSEQ